MGEGRGIYSVAMFQNKFRMQLRSGFIFFSAKHLALKKIARCSILKLRYNVLRGDFNA